MQRHFPIFLALVLMIAILAFVNLLIGSVAIPIGDVCRILVGNGDNEIWQNIIFQSRLPQALTAIAAGAGLAVSGLQMQTVFRNPLAGPSVLGISNGSALGVAFVVLLSGRIGGVALSRLGYLGDAAMSVAAIVGALAVMMLIVWISQKVKGNVTLLIIAFRGADVYPLAVELSAGEADEPVIVRRPLCRQSGVEYPQGPLAGDCLLRCLGGDCHSLLRPHHVHRPCSSPSGPCHLPHFRSSCIDASHDVLRSSPCARLQSDSPYAGFRGSPACQ